MVTGRFGRNESGLLRPWVVLTGSFPPILGVSRFGLGRLVVSANFQGGSFRPRVDSAKVHKDSKSMRRKDNRLTLLYKGLKGKARIPTDDLIPKNRRC